MTVAPVPFEPERFFVSSESRSDVCHIVDVRFKLEPWSKPVVACGCESNFIYGRPCKHILAVANFLKALT